MATRDRPLASGRHTFHFLLIVAGIALAGFVQTRGASLLTNPARGPLYFSLAALQLLFVWFVNKGIRAHGYSLGDLLGNRWRKVADAFRDAGLVLALVVGLRGLNYLVRLFAHPVARVNFLLPRTPFEAALWVALSIIASVAEELVYRGYLQRQFHSFFQSWPLAILLQAIVFGLAHVYQGWSAATLTAMYGLAFGSVAAWRKTIIPGIIAHSAIDIIAGLRLA